MNTGLKNLGLAVNLRVLFHLNPETLVSMVTKRKGENRVPTMEGSHRFRAAIRTLSLGSDRPEKFTGFFVRVNKINQIQKTALYLMENIADFFFKVQKLCIMQRQTLRKYTYLKLKPMSYNKISKMKSLHFKIVLSLHFFSKQ